MTSNNVTKPNSTLEVEASNMPIHAAGVASGNERQQEVEVDMGSMIPHIASVASLAMEPHGVEASRLEKYFNSLVHYRVMQIRGELRTSFNDIAVPSFFFPVLTSLGVYDDPMKNIRIVPKSCIDPMTIEEVQEMSFELRRLGATHSLGLPRSTDVESDEIFRVMEDNRELKAAGVQPSNLTLLIRTAVKVEFLKEFFGAPTTRYITVDDSRPAWEAAVLRLMK